MPKKTKTDPTPVLDDGYKEHTTVTITEDVFAKIHACLLGRDNARPLLPATLSTDPRDNLELAKKWCKTSRAFDLYYFALGVDNIVGTPGPRLTEQGIDGANDVVSMDLKTGWQPDLPREIYPLADAWIVAQYMAWIADSIATREGR